MFVLYGGCGTEWEGGPNDVIGIYKTIDAAKSAFYEANLDALDSDSKTDTWEDYHSHPIHKGAWANIAKIGDHRYEIVLVFCSHCSNNAGKSQWESPPYPDDFKSYTIDDYETDLWRERMDALREKYRLADRAIA